MNNGEPFWRKAAMLLLHSGTSTVIAMVIVVCLAFLLGLFVSKENKIVDYIVIGPSFLLPIVVGGSLAPLTLRFFPSRTAGWAWVLPAFLFGIAVHGWTTQPVRYPNDIWNNFFGTQCGSSECLYELLFTAPFVSSDAYSIAAILYRLLRKIL